MVQHIAKTERLRKNQGYKPMGFSLMPSHHLEIYEVIVIPSGLGSG